MGGKPDSPRSEIQLTTARRYFHAGHTVAATEGMGGAGTYYLADRTGNVVGKASATGVVIPTGIDAPGDYSGRLKHDADGDIDIWTWRAASAARGWRCPTLVVSGSTTATRAACQMARSPSAM